MCACACVCVDSAGFLLEGVWWWRDSRACGREPRRRPVLCPQPPPRGARLLCACAFSPPRPRARHLFPCRNIFLVTFVWPGAGCAGLGGWCPPLGRPRCSGSGVYGGRSAGAVVNPGAHSLVSGAEPGGAAGSCGPWCLRRREGLPRARLAQLVRWSVEQRGGPGGEERAPWGGAALVGRSCSGGEEHLL